MKQASYKDHPVWGSMKRFITVTSDRVVLESFGQKIFEVDLEANTLYSYRYGRESKNKRETISRMSKFTDLARIFWLKEGYDVVFVNVCE